MTVVVAVKAGLKLFRPCISLSCCAMGTHLTLNLSIESTSLMQHYAARLVSISSRRLSGAKLKNTRSTQCVPLFGLLTTKYGTGNSRELKTYSAIRITPDPGVKLPSCEVQACPCWPQPSTPVSPASSMSIRSLLGSPWAGLPRCSLQKQCQQ